MNRTIAILAAAGLCLLPACGDDDETSSGGGSSTSASSSPAKVTVKVTESGKTSKLSLPESIKAGPVEISLDNTGKAPHSAQLIRVEGDHSVKEIEKITDTEGGPIPGWLHAAGGIGTVAPGESGTVTQVLKPGTYYAEDDDAEKNEGLVKFSVTGEGGGELPSTPATVTATEYKFEPSGLKPGSNRLTFDNAGKELHHLIAVPIKKGATFAEVKKSFASEGESGGPPPVDFEKTVGTSIIDGGESLVTDLELQKGKYAFVCFIQDRAGGPPHAAKGMLQEVTVK